MSIIVWNDGGGGSLWSTDANWVGGVAPIATDTVQFDATSVANSSADIEVAGVDQQAAYSGTVTVVAAIALGDFSIAAGAFDFGTLLVSINDYTRSGGTVTGSSDVLNITGDTLITGGTFVHNSGQVGLIRTTSSQNWDSTVIDELFQLRIAKIVWDVIILDQKIEVSDRLIIENAEGTSAQLRGIIDLIDTATLEQNGNLYDSGLLGQVRFVGTTHEWIQNVSATNAQMPLIYVDCTSLTLTEGAVGNRFGFWKLITVSGTVINAAVVHIQNNQQFTHTTFDLFEDITFGQLTWIAGNFDLFIENARTITVLGDTSVTNLASGSQFFGVGSTLALKGNYFQTGNASNISTLRVLFNGTGVQNISMTGGIDTIPTNLLEIDKPSGSVRLVNAPLDQSFTNDAILVTNGTFDLNGFDVSVRTDFTVNGDLAGLSGSTITVDDNFAAVNAQLIGAAQWFLNVQGTNTAQDCNIGGCDASGGVTLQAQTSVNFGFNFNVLFGGEPEDPNLFFRILQHLWPISRAFDTTKQDKQFTEFNQALTFLGEESKRFTDDVYGDLFPETTRELDSWEQQWNLPFNSALTEQERRDRLASAWSSLGGQSPRYIQDTIQGAGFTNVFIHEWWDLAQLPAAVAHDPNLILQGNQDLLVNIITFTVKDFITGLDEAVMECGEVQAQLGQYTQFIFSEFVYEIPNNPALYPYFLYFGAETFPTRATVPASREAEFKELLLKICPAQQWLGLLIDYV